MRVERIGLATLYLGDCREIAPTLERPAAVISDPPYGIGIARSHRLATSRGFGSASWDDEPADATWLLALDVPTVLWGGNYFRLPPCRRFLVWDKDNDGRDFADGEFAWTNLDAVARIFRMRPQGMDGGKQHPTQKPVALMRWCIEQAKVPTGGLILDPYKAAHLAAISKKLRDNAERRRNPESGAVVQLEQRARARAEVGR